MTSNAEKDKDNYKNDLLIYLRSVINNYSTCSNVNAVDDDKLTFEMNNDKYQLSIIRKKKGA